MVQSRLSDVDALAEEDEEGLAALPSADDADPSQRFLESLRGLVSKTRDLNARDVALLSQREATVADIERKRALLQQRAQVVERVQSCLEQGPPSEQLRAQQAKLDEVFAQVHEQVARHKDEAARTLAQLGEQKAGLEARERTLQEREAELRRQQEAQAAKQALLQQREAVVAKSEAAVDMRLRAVQKRAEPAPSVTPTAPATPAAAAAAPASPSRLESECSSLSDCHSCVSNARCGWCRKPARCLLHDVNAKFHGQLAGGGDGLTSGQCSAEHWGSGVTARLALLTYNVFGADPARTMERSQAVIDLLKKTRPDFAAFQQMEAWLLSAFSEDSFVKEYYHQTDFGSGQAPGGLYILSKYPLSNVAYAEEVLPGQTETSMRARLLSVQALVGERLLTVATTNLDWRSGANRAQSLDFIFSVLSPSQDVVLMGDFNFDAGSDPETAHLPLSYVDVWPQLRDAAKEPGFTWDPDTNPYAKLSDPNSRPSRIDRVFIKSTQWLARTIKLVGCRATDVTCETPNAAPAALAPAAVPAAYPSNHYALLVEASRFTPHC